MTPRAPLVLLLSACAGRLPAPPGPAPRRPVAPLPQAAPLAPPADARTLATRARCAGAGLTLASPGPVIERRCPWGRPGCEGEGAVVVRNCGREHAKLTALTVVGSSPIGVRAVWRFGPDDYGPLAPFTELRVPIALLPQVTSLRVRAELARGARGASTTLHTTASVRDAPLLAPGTSDVFGEEAPILSVESAPDGRWVALCTARGAGVAASFWREGRSSPIDDFLAADPSGRFVALLLGRRVVLRDTATDRDDALDVGDAPAAPGDFSFDASGQRMAYRRRRGGRATVVVRALATAQEVVVNPGAGRLWRAWIDAGGAWVVAEVVARDTNRDGHLSLPSLRPAPAARWCYRRVPSCVRGRSELDALETRVAPAAGGAATAVPGLLRPLGDALLVRAPDGALALVDARGGATELAPAACGARLLDVDEPRRQVAVLCAREARGAMGPLVFYAPGSRRAAGVALPFEPSARWHEGTRTFYGRAYTWVVDHAHGALRRFPVDHIVRWSAGDRALLVHPGGAALFDAAREGLEQLPLDAVPSGFVSGRAPVLWSDSTLLDVAQRRVLGRVAGVVLAATTDGRALVPAVPAAERRGVPTGPLRWVRPTPATGGARRPP
jgi:hypothetical protein